MNANNASTSTLAIETRGLTKTYGKTTVVDHIDLAVPRGSVVGFIGPNGAGKTTTMRLLLGLIAPTEGEGAILGHPLSDPSSFLGEVGAMIEGPAFYPWLSARHNLKALATLGDRYGRQDREGRIDAVLERVNLADRAEDRFSDYSMGMKQRLGIAASLLRDPELLMLDEPVNGLDPNAVKEVRDLIKSLAAEGRTVFVSSHLLAELELVCDDVVLIQGGKLTYQGSIDAMRAPSQRFLVRPEFANSIDLVGQSLASLDVLVEPCAGGMEVSGPNVNAAEINRRCFAAGVTLTEISPIKISLEDAFLSMTE